MVVGFADDTNLFVANDDIATNCKQLEDAYKVCEDWAKTRGMAFAPQKSELIHFTKIHAAP